MHKRQHPPLGSRSGINRLPPEVLAHVFYSCSADALSSWNHYAQVTTLVAVCSLWRDIVNTTPALWRFLNNNFPEEAIGLIIQRSGTVPLTIDVARRPTKQRQLRGIQSLEAKSNLVGFRRTVLSNAARWEVVVLKLSQNEQLSALAVAEVPHLISFTIMWSGVRGRAGVELFGKGAPRLRELQCYGIAPPWTSGVFRGLVTLKVSRPDGPSAEQLVDILATVLRLEVLWIGAPTWEWGMPLKAKVNQVVAKRLRTLELETLGLSYAVKLIPLIQAPQLEKLQLYIYDDLAVDSSVERHLAYLDLFSHHLQTYHRPDQMTVAVYMAELVLEETNEDLYADEDLCSGHSITVKGNYSTLHPADALAAVLIDRSMTLSYLRLVVEDDVDTEMSLVLAALRRLPKVKAFGLALESSPRMPAELREWLARGDLFPDIEEFIIIDRYYAKDILGILRGRYDARPPKKLKTLRMPHEKDEDLEIEIREIVGEECALHWN